MSEQILNAPAETPAEQITENQPPADAGQSILSGEPGGTQLDLFPEAFRVMNGDALDVNASAAKLAEAYNARAAFGEIPAADAEYNAPEGFEGWEEIKQMDAVKTFTEEARKLGMTHAQYSFALKEIAAAELDGRNYAQQSNRDESERVLREAWADKGTYDLNIKQANNAVTALVAPDERAGFLAKYGSDAQIIKMLARIGGELSEDQSVGLLEPIPTGEDLRSLMASEAYTNSKHPQHAEVFARVQRAYTKTYGNEATL